MAVSSSPLLSDNLSKYLNLRQQYNQIQCMYVWIDGTGKNMRTKTRTLPFVPKHVTDVPKWTFDGSSTSQAEEEGTDVYLYPIALYSDPFHRGHNKICLCETYNYEKHPTKSNKRKRCLEIMDKAKDHHPWFGIKQEYTLLDADKRPCGWSSRENQESYGLYYCAVGADKIHGRDVVEAHYKACLFAGIKISGINADIMPSQWEFQIGPCEGIRIGDDLWMARFLLQRIAEDFRIIATFDPKPVFGTWSLAWARTNFSTKAIRNRNGIKEIESAIEKLKKKHKYHIKAYDPDKGIGPKYGLYTSKIEYFTSGIGNRQASIRIPKHVVDEGRGYFEDRRPPSNCDPYVVAKMLVKTICLDSSSLTVD